MWDKFSGTRVKVNMVRKLGLGQDMTYRQQVATSFEETLPIFEIINIRDDATRSQRTVT